VDDSDDANFGLMLPMVGMRQLMRVLGRNVNGGYILGVAIAVQDFQFQGCPRTRKFYARLVAAYTTEADQV